MPRPRALCDKCGKPAMMTIYIPHRAPIYYCWEHYDPNEIERMRAVVSK